MLVNNAFCAHHNTPAPHASLAAAVFLQLETLDLSYNKLDAMATVGPDSPIGHLPKCVLSPFCCLPGMGWAGVGMLLTHLLCRACTNAYDGVSGVAAKAAAYHHMDPACATPLLALGGGDSDPVGTFLDAWLVAFGVPLMHETHDLMISMVAMVFLFLISALRRLRELNLSGNSWKALPHVLAPFEALVRLQALQ